MISKKQFNELVNALWISVKLYHKILDAIDSNSHKIDKLQTKINQLEEK